MSALVCHQREAVDEDVEEDTTELNELARERAGELEEDSSVKAEETESSLSETYETASLRLLAARESGGHAWGPVSSAGEATRLRLRRRPPLLVRLCKLCWWAPSMVK